MLEYFKQILIVQYEASLAMLNQCIDACSPEHWDGKIAQGTFRWVTYHTLFFTDLYLSPSNEAFELRELHRLGGDERGPDSCIGLSKDEALAYVVLCRDKMLASIASETDDSLAGASGFSWYKITRGEMHLVNIRHIQHHTGQLSAFLRRIDNRFRDRLWPHSNCGSPVYPILHCIIVRSSRRTNPMCRQNACPSLLVAKTRILHFSIPTSRRRIKHSSTKRRPSPRPRQLRATAR
jgi:hypothetical protein